VKRLDEQLVTGVPLFARPALNREHARLRAEPGRVYVVRQVADPEKRLPSNLRQGVPAFVRVLALALAVTLGACARPARPPMPDAAGDVDVLGAQVFALAAAPTPECTAALRRARQRGGVVFVHRSGHCDFVRELPSRKR
jgi:hypothetical protein